MNYQKIMDSRNNANSFRNMLGIRLIELDEHHSVCEMPISSQMENQIHSVAGGCHYAIADSAAGALCATSGYKATTVNADYHYLKAGINCKKIRAEGRIIKRGKRLGVIYVEVSDQDGNLLSAGTFTFAFLKEKLEYLEEE